MTGPWTTTLLAAAIATTLTVPLVAEQPRAGRDVPPDAARAEISDATVEKTGAALRQIAGIRQEFSQRIQAAPAQREALTEEAGRAAVQAINAHGLSVEEYRRVIQLAQEDDELRARVLAAAQTAR